MTNWWFSNQNIPYELTTYTFKITNNYLTKHSGIQQTKHLNERIELLLPIPIPLVQ
jgi:hypothetical protein